MTESTDTLIIGGGLSGLAVAHYFRTTTYGHRFILVEKASQTGGAIRTHHENGYIAEIGPHGFLDNCHESREILDQTGLTGECLKSPLRNFVRYVLLNQKLTLIPQSPLSIIGAPLIPWKDKFRVLADLWKKPLTGEPSVANWIEHRFGKALLPFGDAVFTGTYAGDINRLSIDAVMPGLRVLEKEHGSLIRGGLKKMAAKKKQRGERTKFHLPAMTSFKDGMERLPKRLTEYLEEGKNLFYNCDVEKIDRLKDAKWQITTTSGIFSADNIVLALPVNQALSLLSSFRQPPMKSLPEAQLVTAVFGFARGERLPPGFGYLIPEQEKRFSLGTLFSSNMFPHRAPNGHILFETLIGGRRHPERITLSDSEIITRAYDDVKDVLHLSTEPVYTRILRPWAALPQLEQGYPSLLQWRDELMDSLPGLFVIGFGWEGIGLNEMVKQAKQTVMRINSGNTGQKGKTAIKGVYF